MKRTWLLMLMSLIIVFTGCDIVLNPVENGDTDVYVSDLEDVIDLELVADVDMDSAIEEEIEIDLESLSLNKNAPGGNNGNNGNNGNGYGKRRIKLGLKQVIDSVSVSCQTEYLADDSALVSLTKSIDATMYIRHKDTSMTQDTMVIWEKPYHYVLNSRLLFLADSVMTDSSTLDTVCWKLAARSIAEGLTDSMLNTIQGVQVETADSLVADFTDPQELFSFIRGSGQQGAFYGRSKNKATNIFAEIAGGSDVKVMAYSGRMTVLSDDGIAPDLTADDVIYSGSVRSNYGRDRLRVRVIELSTFLEEDAPVNFSTWFLPIR